MCSILRVPEAKLLSAEADWPRSGSTLLLLFSSFFLYIYINISYLAEPMGGKILYNGYRMCFINGKTLFPAAEIKMVISKHV